LRPAVGWLPAAVDAVDRAALRLLRTLVQRVLARPPKPPALDGLPKAPG